MYLSDPGSRADGLDQFGEYHLFMQDGHIFDSAPLFPCGRLHGAPGYFTVDATWTYQLDDGSYLEPVDPAQRLLFKDIFLKREPLYKYVAPSSIVEWIAHTVPKIQAYSVHFRSSKFTILESPYFGMTWYLTYGAGDILQGFQFTEQADYSTLSYGLQDFDCRGIPGGNVLGSPPQYFGWTLLLVRQIFTLQSTGTIVDYRLGIPTDPNIVVEYRTYGAWTLPQPDTDPPDPLFPAGSASQAIFDPTVVSVWRPYHNPLNFPPHYLTLSPFQP